VKVEVMIAMDKKKQIKNGRTLLVMLLASVALALFISGCSWTEQSINGTQVALSQTTERTVNMKFTGDVMFADNVERLLKQKGYSHPYKYVGKLLRSAHLTAINLETPLSKRGTRADKQYAYRSDPAHAKLLASEAGVDVVTLANNHSMDYGKDALLDTFKYLTEQKIAYVGAGRDRKRAFQPIYLSGNGVRVGFIGVSRVVPEQSWKAGTNKPGTADTYDPSDAVKSIREAASKADLVVVLAHWGKERSDYPEAYQKTLARTYIDAGADLIIGSHPHVLQGFEQYKGKWIAYSLGNFIFTTNAVPKTWDSAVLSATCKQSGACDLTFIPVRTKYAQPVVLYGQSAQNLIKRISSISLGAQIEASGKIVLPKKR
jgi:poly-gamma-glutamate capsule biosynthesis protein CapA/YwtB (metallophosphatase superfamily)